MSENVTVDHSTVLVTGATGFIGNHLVKNLLDRGCEVHCLVRKTSDLKDLDSPEVQFHYGDLSECDVLNGALPQVNYVFHLAGLTKAKTRKEYFRINAEACNPLYQSLEKYGKHLRGVVHLSSLASVGPSAPGETITEETPCKPITYYGKSKLAGENIARKFSESLPLIILRPPVVYGPKEKNFFQFLALINKKINLRLGTHQRTLSLLYVQDLVRAMLEAADGPLHEDNTFFITDGNVYPWEEIVQTAESILNVSCRSITIPETALALGAFIVEGFARFRNQAPLLDSQRMKDIKQSSWTASSNKFFDHYGFQPEFDMKTGLAQTLAWYQENKWL
jgi:nucleoside-diphosphate-sugar epimerase